MMMMKALSTLKERASVIKDKTGDFELNAIILRLMTYDGSEKLTRTSHRYSKKINN